jgi:ferredoxin
MFQQMFKILTGRSDKMTKAPSLDGLLESMDKHSDNLKTFVSPAPESKPRTPFDSGLPASEVGLANLKGRQRLQAISKALPLMLNMQIASRMYDRPFVPRHSRISPELLNRLERLAYAAGVKDIRYVQVPANAIFQGKKIPYPYAIVFTVEMDKEPIATSPSWDSQHEVMRGYKNMAVIGNKLARYLRREGFAAYPGTALGGVTDYVHLAELAGLGAIGYHGLLISPGEGARLRINTIYTNIENLPLQSENEHLWVRDFCSMCKKCVRKCPVSAIYDQPQPRGDGGMQCIDHATCRDYFTRNYGCAVCLAVCPFSQVGYDKVQERFKGNPDAPQFQIPVREIGVNG